MDLHLPDPRYEKGFEGNAFISEASFGSYPMPYWIPYRCLFSRNVGNLFMAGRDISVTHEALGSARVMRTGGCMGEIVGMAASLAVQHRTSPRAVYERHLDELQSLMRRGAGKASGASTPYVNQGEPARKPAPVAPSAPPAWLAQAGANLARTARVTVSSATETAGRLNDGQADLADNSQRWLSAADVPVQIELAWGAPQTFNTLRILSGYSEGSGSLVGAVEAWTLQTYDGAGWHDVLGAGATGNTRADWSSTFPAQTAACIRLSITASRGDIARLWEIELYRVP
jgi:hypothetical protein